MVIRRQLCRDKGFVCRDIAGEVLEEECRDIYKANGRGTLSQHKELKMAEELCRDKRQLCRDRKWQSNETSQDK